MRTRLIQVEKRISELEALADDILESAQLFAKGSTCARSILSTKFHIWRIGSHALLEKVFPAEIERFEDCNFGAGFNTIDFVDTVVPDIPNQAEFLVSYHTFQSRFAKARGILRGCVEGLKSSEFDVLIQLSSALVSDEFDTALQLYDVANGDQSILRAAGTVARVALERHLLTVAEARSITIDVNPPTKKKPEAQDAINSLAKASVVTAIQKSELETLFRIGNNCAHPKESIKPADVEKLIVHGREMAATIV